MSEPGAIFYRGPSLLTGDPIVGVVTGLEGGSHNPKTGPMAQAWILREDLAPNDAVHENLDDAIGCGTIVHHLGLAPDAGVFLGDVIADGGRSAGRVLLAAAHDHCQAVLARANVG